MSDKKQYHLDRGRGLLTKKDREYLLGKQEYEDNQQQRNRRQYIRDRVRNGILDFSLLYQLERRDRERIFRSLNQTSADTAEKDEKEAQYLLEGLSAMIWLAYFASSTTNISFRKLLETGIGKAEEELSGRTLSEIRLGKRYVGGEVEESAPFAEFEGRLTEDEHQELQDSLERALYILEESKNRDR